MHNFAPNDENQPSVTITGNRVGILKGVADVILKRSNGSNGLLLDGVSKALIGSVGNIDKNFISGNVAAGILIGNGSSDNTVNNTVVGTAENNAADLGNGGPGIILQNSFRTILGGTNYTQRNSIAGNGGTGVLVSGALSANNKLHNNFIGISPNGNGLRNNCDGVLITDGAKLNEVGGTGEDDGNLIAYSSGAGELIVNYKVDSAPGDLSIPGTSNYGTNGIYVEFFKADATGQGAQFLGFGYYTTADYNNGSPQMRQINLGDAATFCVTADDKITATATDADNNTSEFFPPFAPTAARVTGQRKSQNRVGSPDCRREDFGHGNER